MKPFLFSIVALLLGSFQVFAQHKLTFSPEKPAAGETVTVTYSLIDQASKGPVEVVVYTSGEKEQDLNTLPLKKKGNTYTGTFQTKADDVFAAVGVKVDGKFDTNGGEGYILPLYEGENLKHWANAAAGLFYSGTGELVGIEGQNNDKALEYLEAEFEGNPEAKKKLIATYAPLQPHIHKDNEAAVYQKAIEWLVKEGPETEADYNRLESLYRFAKLPAQMAFITKIKKEKFPEGTWRVNEQVNAFIGEKDQQKKEELLQGFLADMKKADDPASLEGARDYMLNQLLTAYAKEKKFDEVDKAIEKFGVSGMSAARTYNSIAWQLQEKDEDLNTALRYAQKAVYISKQNISSPADKKPFYQTAEDWKKARRSAYSMYADTYAMVQYKLKNYKEGFPYAKEAAIDIQEGKNADFNKTYVLLAKNVLPAKKLQGQLEKFVIEGAADSTTTAALKSVYKGDWEKYYGGLRAKANEKAMAELRKSMISDPSPTFALTDAKGQKVDLNSLKNKVVVVDFWATWCGPCKASFPGMQKMVEKYKNDQDVVFLFVNSWESIEDQKEKEETVNKFIADNKYDFRVLFDNDNRVIESYGVSGIPTKFVLDKNGNIRFKSVGYSGSDEKLVDELTGMIELARKG